MKNNVEIIKGINMTIAGLEAIKTALENGEVEAPATEKTPAKKTVAKGKAQKEEPMNAPEENEGAVAVAGKFDEEQLRNMKYNDFKKFAASLGVDCKGTRDEIMARVLALDVEAEVESGDAPAEEEKTPAKKTAKSDKLSGGKKLSKKQADEPARDEFDEQAEEVAKDTPVEDIISALADVDVKATKKNAVTKLAEALRKGLIELDGDDDEDESEAEEDTAEETEDTADDSADDEEVEIEATSYFEQFDPDGYNNPDNMTDERREAVEAKMDEIITEYSDGSLTSDDISSYIEDNATQEEIDLLGDDYTDDDLLMLYMELNKRNIDNDGEEHEPNDPYEVGDANFCCGHELKYEKNTKKFICEHCGEEYEVE